MKFKSPKSTFAFERFEILPQTSNNQIWHTVTINKPFAYLLFQDISLQNNFLFTDNSSSSTVIINFYKTFYATESLELHLTGVKDIDSNNNDVISTLHLTLRHVSKNLKSRSFYYELQASRRLDFRFTRNDYAENNQTDDMDEFLGFQGFHNFSSAVLQPILQGISMYFAEKKAFIDGRCLKLHMF